MENIFRSLLNGEKYCPILSKLQNKRGIGEKNTHQRKGFILCIKVSFLQGNISLWRSESFHRVHYFRTNTYLTRQPPLPLNTIQCLYFSGFNGIIQNVFFSSFFFVSTHKDSIDLHNTNCHQVTYVLFTLLVQHCIGIPFHLLSFKSFAPAATAYMRSDIIETLIYWALWSVDLYKSLRKLIL